MVIVLFFANILVVKKTSEDIRDKQKELREIQTEISEWEYVNNNDDLQEILKQNRIVPLYSYTEAIKDTIEIFKRPGVVIDNVEVKRYSANAVDININCSASTSKFLDIADAINNADTLIVLETVDMNYKGGGSAEWEIKMKRYYNI